MRKCTKCHQNKNENEFLVSKTGKQGHRCKSCRAKYHLAWYHKTKHSRVELRKKYRLTSRRRLMKVVVDYLLKHPCVDCGEADIMVLDFDHLGNKTKAVSAMLRDNGNKKRILEEIAKCEVRCANCHRRKTAERGNWHLKQGLLTQQQSVSFT